MNKPITCDIFCAVIDNFGDIGVCWRLAKQLVHEHDMTVRLWVDDLLSFRRLHPAISPDMQIQHCLGVEIRHWNSTFLELPFPKIEPAQLVIEAFACELPECYVAAIVGQEYKPIWVNLEYLSAEEWVAGCHCLPSPNPSLPITKYFFFPGFTLQTGGLLLERDLIARRDAFQSELHTQAAFWRALDVPLPKPDEVRVSLFCYENIALPELFSIWAKANIPMLCLVPEDCVLPQVAAFFGRELVVAGDTLQHGNLEVRVLPFIAQERYDELLWACDLNFVRGEDSCVRAQWAGKPFVWHIYPQQDKVHIKKLSAFMDLYCSGLQPDATQALYSLWQGWNIEHNGGQAASTSLKTAWDDYWEHIALLQRHAREWSQHLSGNSLVLNLLNFVQKIDRIGSLECKLDLR
ncbi:elongation factor P maturation arginine rhamnosyltransferase EarP [Candidatus Nitrotoga arctica]|nr:elongation factor P maturation arginine rhamnosyltransferase EarP [Candidatus Nitrotoga arctica]